MRMKSLPWITRDIRALMRTMNNIQAIEKIGSGKPEERKLSFFQALSEQSGNNNKMYGGS